MELTTHLNVLNPSLTMMTSISCCFVKKECWYISQSVVLNNPMVVKHGDVVVDNMKALYIS